MDDQLSEHIKQAEEAVKTLRSLGLPKPEPMGRLVARLAEEANTYPVPNLAVQICLQSYISNKKELLDKGNNPVDVERAARIAYAGNLPMLSNADCIRDFIACVVHGMAIGAILSSEGTRLLYGAQVAHSALPGGRKRRTKRLKKRTEYATLPSSNSIFFSSLEPILHVSRPPFPFAILLSTLSGQSKTMATSRP
jgi:hypothetical protein